MCSSARRAYALAHRSVAGTRRNPGWCQVGRAVVGPPDGRSSASNPAVIGRRGSSSAYSTASNPANRAYRISTSRPVANRGSACWWPATRCWRSPITGPLAPAPHGDPGRAAPVAFRVTAEPESVDPPRWRRLHPPARHESSRVGIETPPAAAVHDRRTHRANPATSIYGCPRTHPGATRSPPPSSS